MARASWSHTHHQLGDGLVRGGRRWPDWLSAEANAARTRPSRASVGLGAQRTSARRSDGSRATQELAQQKSAPTWCPGEAKAGARACGDQLADQPRMVHLQPWKRAPEDRAMHSAPTRALGAPLCSRGVARKHTSQFSAFARIVSSFPARGDRSHGHARARGRRGPSGCRQGRLRQPAAPLSRDCK